MRGLYYIFSKEIHAVRFKQYLFMAMLRFNASSVDNIILEASRIDSWK